jgi:hypothetical protein
MGRFFNVNRRAKATALHLVASLSIAVLVSLLVFWVWFPSPYSAIAGGTSLFFLIVSVDVVLGPALTGVIANPNKSALAFARDLAVIVALQLGAFGYGIYTMAQARPVLLAFEVDRLRVVAAADIDPSLLNEAPPALRQLPWTGPRLIAAVKPTDPNDQMKAMDLGLAGIDLSMQPKQWREYPPYADEIWRKARPISALLAKHPEFSADVAVVAQKAGQPVDALRFLPLMSRQASWVSLIAAPGAQLVGHLPVDGFF